MYQFKEIQFLKLSSDKMILISPNVVFNISKNCVMDLCIMKMNTGMYVLQKICTDMFVVTVGLQNLSKLC